MSFVFSWVSDFPFNINAKSLLFLRQRLMYESDDRLESHQSLNSFSFSRTLNFSVRGIHSNKQNNSHCGHSKRSLCSGGIWSSGVFHELTGIEGHRRIIESKMSMHKYVFWNAAARVTCLVSVFSLLMIQILVVSLLRETAKWDHWSSLALFPSVLRIWIFFFLFFNIGFLRILS